MAKVYCNCSLKNGEKRELKNGSTKRTLCLINKSGRDIEYNIPFNADLGFLKKGNHSFVFINFTIAMIAMIAIIAIATIAVKSILQKMDDDDDEY